MLAYTRFEILRTLRNGRFLVLTIGMPALLYLLFNGIYGPADGSRYSAYILVSMAAYSAIGSAMYSGGSLPAERASGWIRQLRITPLSSSAWLRGRLLQALLVVLPGFLVVSLCALTLGHVRLAPERWLELGAIVLAGSIPFICLGLLIGQLLDAQVSQPAQAAVLLVASFAGGLFFPMSSLPSTMQAIGRALPSYHMFVLGQQAMAGQALSLDQLAALAGSIAAFGVVTLLVWHRGGASRLV
jgi:ABC-2 type transport system permease protein